MRFLRKVWKGYADEMGPGLAVYAAVVVFGGIAAAVVVVLLKGR